MMSKSIISELFDHVDEHQRKYKKENKDENQ